MPTLECAILGGGIAGLSAAFELNRRGIAAKVFEGSTSIGGLIRTEHVDGFTIDQGPDSLLAQKPAALELCHELGLSNRLITTSPPRVAYILRDGRLHSLPEGSVLGIPTHAGSLMSSRLFSPTAKMRIAAEYLLPPRHESGDESIGHFVRRRFGEEAVRYIAEPLLAGIHAGDVDRLSIGALFPRLVEAEQQHGSVLRAFRNERRVRDPGGAFRSLAGGLRELIDALEAALPAGSIETGAPIAALDRDSTYSIRDALGRSFSARAIILATPTYVTSELVRRIDEGLADLLAGIRYASSAAIALGYRRSSIEHALSGSGFVIPRVEGLTLLAATWTSSKWTGRAPADHVLVRGYVGDRRSPDALSLDDRAIIDLTVRELSPVLGIRGEPTLARVYRWPRANAQYEVGHLARVRSIDRRVSEHPGLFLTGSGLRGVGIPDCVADARATARRVMEWLERTA